MNLNKKYTEDNTSDASLEANLFECIKTAGNITFVDLQQKFGEGDFGIYLDSLNIILWGGLREEICHALVSLKNKGRIKYAPCSVLVYILEGMAMVHPVVITAPPEGGFKELCWFPVVILANESKIEG
ncbi:MAG: hypothetical protein FIA99_14760 [Ruminiclostridium sp.]|nr:hypothetical protein [Ruminiclostridium sp.]